jgi:hypothetical protein
MIGQRFNRLLVVEKQDKIFYKCICDCGKDKVVRKYNLLNGNTRSCGCLMSDAKKKHGLRYENKRLYHIWGNMRQRCSNQNHRDYKNYGGRGIDVCTEWESYEDYHRWSMKNGYSGELSLDRIDNNAGYSPNNCRWTDSKTQNNNRRTNIKCLVDGRELTLMQLANEYGISYSRVSYRYKKGHRGNELIIRGAG